MVSFCRRSRSAALITAGLIPAVLAAGMVAVPAAAKEPIVEYRQSVMQAIGGHTGALAKIIPGKVTFSDDAKAHVLALAALAKMAGEVFPPGSDKETDALPAIWEKPADFTKAVSGFQAVMADLAKQADAAPKDMAPAFESVVKACKNCHDNFRKKS
jgi:cytochrome c556